MKMRSMHTAVVGLCIAGLSCALAAGQEKVRKWTRQSDGRTLEAVLLDKGMDPVTGEDAIKLRLPNGKKTKWMELSIFSKQDQAYVAKADLRGELFMTSHTVFAQGEDGEEGVDRRTVEVTVTNTNDKSFQLKIVWLGKKGSTNGIHKIETDTIKADGVYTYRTLYPRNSGDPVHRVYRGYAVGLTDGVRWIVQDSAQPPHMRFLGTPSGE